MSALTPADLAKFAYPIPDGTVVPVGTNYAWSDGDRIQTGICHDQFVQGVAGAIRPRWTTEPLTPEPTLAERIRALLDDDSFGYWAPASVALVGLVAELAERIEAQS